MADIPPPPPGFTLDPDPAASAPVPIIPRTPAPQTTAQASKDVSDATTSANNAQVSGFKVKEEALTEQKQQAQKDMMTEGVDRLVSAVESAKGLVNNWSTGWGGAALQHLPDTDAARLKAQIDQELKGNVFLSTIQQRQADTPGNGGNGSPGGRVLQSEVPMITGALGTLDPVALGPQGTTEKLNQIAYRALRAKAILNGQDPSDPNVQKQYGIDKYAAMLPSADVVGQKPDSNPTAPSAVGGAAPPPSGPTGGSTLPVQTANVEDNGPHDPSTTYVDDPTLKAANGKVSAMIAGGASAKDVSDYISGLGVDVNRTGGGVPSIADQIQNAVNWRAKNPQYKGGYHVRLDTEQSQIDQRIAAQNKAGVDQQDPAARTFLSGASLGLRDETAGAANAIENATTAPFTGNFDPVGAYQLGRDAERQKLGDAENQLGAAATPVEIIGGLVSGNPESAIAKLGTEAPTVAQVVKQGARAGGAYGVVSGYGNGQGLENSVVGADVGGLTGAAVGAAGGRLFAGKSPPPTPPGAPATSDIADAMVAEGIPGARPIADPSVRGQMAYLETTRGGHAIVQDSIAKTRQAIADKVAGLAGDGAPQSPGTMGENIQAAGIRTLQDAKDAAQGVYKQAETSAGNTPITPTLALDRLDSYIDKLSRNPDTNAGVISYLKGIRSDLAVPEPAPTNTGLLDQNGNPILRQTPAQPKTLADLRDIMTGANDKINFQNLQKTRAEGIMFDVGKALNQDISGTLQNANPQALDLYNKADGMWRDMSNLRQQVVKRLVGPADNPLSGEQTMARVTQMMSNKGDLSRFQRTINMMTPQEQSDFRASLWENIGQRSPEEGFTPDQFLAQTKNMQSDALKAVFGEDGAKSVQNLRVASRGLLDAQGALNNSRSGFVNQFKDALGSVLTLKHTGAAGVGYSVAGVPGAVVGSAVGDIGQRTANRISAKTLMNPDVSQWIRKAAAVKTPQQAQAMLGKLNGIAATNVALQSELSGLRDSIMRALNDNVPNAGRAVASPNGGPNQQQQPNGSPAPAIGQ